MEADYILSKFQKKRGELFKAQNPETGKFDVAFEVEGKKLYAHKYMLCPISPTFESMLSDRWTKSNEDVIKIEGYSFVDFKEFLTFIYTGECVVNEENIAAMVDMAEFYGIEELKREFEEYLIGILDLKNIRQLVVLANKYSMKRLKNYVGALIAKNYEKFVDDEKSTMKDLLEANTGTFRQEQMFQMVYNWGYNRLKEKRKLGQNLVFKEGLKEELSEILPLIEFEKMKHSYISDYATLAFLFTDDQFSKIAWVHKRFFVKVIDKNGKIMKGELQCDDAETVAKVIQSKKDQKCDLSDAGNYYWVNEVPVPSTKSTLIKKDFVHWYLVFDDGFLKIKNRNKTDEDFDYLIAEMFPEERFKLSRHCKIEVF